MVTRNPEADRVHRENVAQAVAAGGSARAASKLLGHKKLHAVGEYLARNPDVAERAVEIVRTRYEESGITAKRVMTELARVAFATAKDIFDDQGNLIPVHMLSDDAAASISGIDVEVHREGRGDDATFVTVKKIRRADKMAALNTLAKHFKIVGDEGDGVNALASALADRLNAAKRRMQPEHFEEAVPVVRELVPPSQPQRKQQRPKKPVRTEASEGTVLPATPPTQENDDEPLW